MSKLNKEELLKWFDRFVFSDIGFTVNRKCAEGHIHCQAYQQIREMIQKPEVTEAWIEEKARELQGKIKFIFEKRFKYVSGEEIMAIIDIAKNFIRSLVKEVQAK